VRSISKVSNKLSNIATVTDDGAGRTVLFQFVVER